MENMFQKRIFQVFKGTVGDLCPGLVVIQRLKTAGLLSIGRVSLPMPSGLLLCASR